jgi:2-keto-3-deoxy-L-rhamnonate aldolase RhmA
MRNSRTLQNIRDGKPVKICALGHFIPPFIALAARAGYDCIWLDMEHRAWNPREIQALMPLCDKYDIDCMVRPSMRDRAQLYRFLEDGATGLLMPHVSTPELAAELVSATKFPPVGDRGLDGAGPDSDFLGMRLDEYVEAAQRNTFLVIQVETPQSVENVERIAATKGLDGIFIGPGDLGLRYRQAGSPEKLEEAIERVAAACHSSGIAWGMPAGTQEEVDKRRSQGAQLLAVGGEFFWLKTGMETAIRMFDD